MTDPVFDFSDAEQAEHYTISAVDSTQDGWYVSATSGVGWYTPNNLCQQAPAIGDVALLLGSLGQPIRGIMVSGRVYLYRTPAEQEAWCEAERQKLRSQQDAADVEWRAQAASLPPLPKFLCVDEEGWQKFVTRNTNDAYSYACCRYAARWAEALERSLATDALDFATIADRASHEADDDGVTGFMYGAAVSILAKFWKHGDLLRRWHNTKTQIGDEGDRANETGGVLNPAVLTVQVDTES